MLGMTEMSKRMREGDRADTSVISDLLETAGEITLIDQLLTEQRTLTAVERFSQKHEDATAEMQLNP
jgi:hypothetical protein